MPKLTTLIVRSKYSYKNKIKIDYKAQFSHVLKLSNKIEKQNQFKIGHKKQLEFI